VDRGALERMLAAGTDNVMLRYALGSALLKASAAEEAVVHLRKGLELAPDHSASWKLLGKALTAAGDAAAAVAAYEQGIATAEAKKDVQAVKEMRVFLKRLRRQLEAG
jgi:predicted Zn-dependent protease